MKLRVRLLAGVWPLLVGTSVSAGVYIDKQLATHCGALLLGGHDLPPTPAAQLTETIHRLDLGATLPDTSYRDVQTLDLDGWDDASKVRASDARLAQLIRDLDRAPAVLSVTFVTRGPARARFLEYLNATTESLDREVQRQLRATRLQIGRSALETLAAAALVVGGGCLADALPPGPLADTVQTAGIVGGAFVARHPARRAWDTFFPGRLLDLRRVQIDSHLRTISAAEFTGRAHIGLSVDVSPALVSEILRARSSLDLNSAHWAKLLTENSRREPTGDRLLVDHLSIFDPESTERVLLSTVRVVRGQPRPTARRPDPRPDDAWFGAPIGLAR